ncbi:MAG TPA: hypothetical protein VEZ20_13170 [Allosphingosinicella sp.]|nr:hypothetical protein [Allosphingosinicella sp.]
MRRPAFGRRAGVSAAALGAALAAVALTPATAAAQATPGSPQCPVVNNIVTCSGLLPDGVAVTSGAYQGLTVTNVAGDMAAAQRPVILYRSDQPNTIIALDDPDSTIRLTTSETLTGTDRLVGAVTATITAPNTSFSLTNNIAIMATELEGGPTASSYLEAVGLLVEGTGGTFSLTNSGDISLTGYDRISGVAGIAMAVSNADLVRVVNSGDIRFISLPPETSAAGSGIAVQADNKRIEIDNSGDMVVPTGSGVFGIFISARAVGLTSTPGVLRPPPARNLESYRIVNSGRIEADDRGIHVSDFLGSFGTPSGEIVNNGTIRSDFAILVRHRGAKSIVNNGILEARTLAEGEFGTFFGIDVGANGGSAPENPADAVRVENAAGGIIRSPLQFSRGISALITPATGGAGRRLRSRRRLVAGRRRPRRLRLQRTRPRRLAGPPPGLLKRLAAAAQAMKTGPPRG